MVEDIYKELHKKKGPGRPPKPKKVFLPNGVDNYKVTRRTKSEIK